MPCNYKEYPENWHEISKRIRLVRAENRCECSGQCGWHVDRCEAVNYKPHPVTGSRVVLTVAHYPDPTKDNCADDNLVAMCQRCHLSVDIAHHVRNRKYGRNHKGKHQLRLFE